MLRLTIIIGLIFHSSLTFGCECARSFGTNFLNQVKDFDVIVLGTFKVDPQTDKALLQIEKIYKGQTDKKSIELIRGGLDCYHLLSFTDGQKIIMGLNKSPFSGQNDGFVAQGCVTSTLYVLDSKVTTQDKTQALPAVKRQRIGFLSRTMKLETVERKIKNRLS